MKKAFLLFLSFTILAVGFWFFVRTTLIHKADAKADAILKAATDSDDPAIIARDAAKYLYLKNDNLGPDESKPLARLRPFLSSRHLPAFVRVPSGAIETIMGEGWCGDYARSLSYILSRKNIVAKQWNLQGSKDAHAVLLVDVGGGALVDSYFGVHSIMPDRIYHPLEIRDALRKGVPLKKMLAPMDKNSNFEFFEQLREMYMGVQGEDLTISVDLPDVKKSTTLGKLDGKNHDVAMAGAALGMTVLWDYVGRRYDFAWTREMRAPSKMRIDLILTEKPDRGILRTFSPPPVVDGTKLSWNLLKDQKIILQSRYATVSLRRLNSYIGVDQIIITPQGDTP